MTKFSSVTDPFSLAGVTVAPEFFAYSEFCAYCLLLSMSFFLSPPAKYDCLQDKKRKKAGKKNKTQRRGKCALWKFLGMSQIMISPL